LTILAVIVKIIVALILFFADMNDVKMLIRRQGESFERDVS